ncbi:hypothetical protein [Olleya namhaensis]|uniref:hypothetical protein n=1 Tax=Olleya namhaensis TaxID=1144750 RepID=UPI00232DBF8F|nr:hypothetical protein [Olleya namhaensis]
MKSLLWPCAIVFAMFSVSYAQDAVPFKTQKAFYIYGEAVAIGNNILSKDATKPYNDHRLTNDDIDMVYVDIDKDDTTFSSSSATLQLPDNHKNIAYAVLYWSATYSYKKGTRREENSQFFFRGERQRNRSVISKIKLKLPGDNYKNITGQVLFDGAKETSFALNSPYVCFADVTKHLQSAKQVNGEYTIGNINATEGFVAGGSAAGWMLYVVYETPTKKPKYITTFNGFTHVGSDPVIINLKDFKTPEKGKTSTDITLAALEGDSALTDDECVIANSQLQKVWKLKSENRVHNNFFSSQITSSNKDNQQRLPNSDNTLGFDIASVTLPNNKDAIITNNTEKVELIFNTKQDRFYLFFTAFQTEISEDYFNKIESKASSNSVVFSSHKSLPMVEMQMDLDKEDAIIKKPIIRPPKVVTPPKPLVIPNPKVQPVTVVTVNPVIPLPEQDIVSEPLVLRQPVKIIENTDNQKVNSVFLEVSASKIQHEMLVSGDVIIASNTYVKALKLEDKPLETQAFKLLLEKNTAQIEGVKKGYYVINKLFSIPKNAIAWQNHLRDSGYASEILNDDQQELYYVYVFHTENFYDAYMQHKILLNKSLFKDNWVFKVNMTEY